MNQSKPAISNAKFSVGDIIHHSKFDYRGVIVDVDADFQLSEEWYDKVAQSRPPKDQPWYHVLVHDTAQMTYVAERNLEADTVKAPVKHPLIDEYFSGFHDGHYQHEQLTN